MPNVDLSYEDIELICARLTQPGVNIDERSQAITARLRAAQGPRSNPENPGDGVSRENYKRSSGI
jgi:hypothetical protein